MVGSQALPIGPAARRLRPVPPELVELIRRRPGGDAQASTSCSDQASAPPGARPPQRSCMTPVSCRPAAPVTGVRQLVVELPLHPAVKLDVLAMALGELGHREFAGCRRPFGPPAPVAAVLLASAHQVAKSSSAVPSRSLERLEKASARPADRGTGNTRCSAFALGRTRLRRGR